MVVTTKLLALLRKDAILVGRNKVWTTFEILIPVLILLLPLFFIKEKTLLLYKREEDTRKSLKSLRVFEHEVHLTPFLRNGKLPAYGCQMPPDVDLRIYDMYLKNHTRPDRINFSQVVSKKVKECHPVGGIFVTSKGVDMIVPSTNDRINQLKYDFSHIAGMPSSSLYDDYSHYLYKAMSIKFRKDAKTLGFNVPQSVERKKIFRISTISTESFSVFSLLSALIGLSITLPVINTARIVTVEKSTIQPYLTSIGLSRTIFYAEHFIFAVLKSSVLILIGILVQCIYLKRFQAFWMILGVFVYILGSISFTLFASIFFIKPRRVVEAVSCVWLISIWVPTNWNGTPSGWATFPALININEALHSYILAIEPHFVKDGGMTFFDGLTSAREGHYCCLVYLLIMAFDAIVLWIASVYLSILVDKISNLIEKRFYSKAKNGDDIEEQSLSSSGDIHGVVLCEEVVKGRSDAPSDLELFNLKKIYPNGETAVNGLSMRTVRGQISVLLGHNGCGKSTTFGMIIGTVEPTSGTIIIEGLDASNNRDILRQSVGYCPQYNPLYEKLTVMEHLKLISALKGACSDDFEKDAHHLLNKIELMDKADYKAGNLSGGMKRKLSMCMAMIGGSKVVLFDEPTAGMDPAARLTVQNMLNEVKPDRTILLTTHYMDEAEKLSDWVFVMSHGKMAASGSGAFLKKKFGDGYTLTLVLESEDHVENYFPVVERLCCALVEGAKMKHARGRMIEITLPENQKSKFLKLFKTIEDIIEKKYDSDEISKMSTKLRKEVRSLKIVTMGLSVSSLEQVFIKIENECDRVLYGIDEKQKQEMAEKSFNELEEAKKEPPLEGARLLFLQACTIFYKRLVHLHRNPAQLIFQFIIPCIILNFLLRGSGLDPPADASLLVNSYRSLSEFPSSKVIIRFEGPPDPRILNYLEQFKHLTVVQFPIQTEISVIVNNETNSDEDLGLIISVWKRKTVVHFKQIDAGCYPIALNLLVNLKYIRLNSSIPVGNNELYIQLVPVKKLVLTDDLPFTIPIQFYNIGMLLSFLVIPAVLFLIEERTTKFQHQQMLTGLSPIVFWAGNISWDTMLFFIGATYTLCLIWIYGTLEDYLYLVYITFYAFFIATVAVVYLTSVLIKSPTIGSTVLLVLHLITFCIGTGLMFQSIIGSDKSLNEVRKMYAFGILDPGYIQMYALTKIYMCQSLANQAFAVARDHIFGFYSIFEFQAIWIDVLYLMLLAVLFFLWFVAITSQVFQRLLSGFKNAQPDETKSSITTSGCASDAQHGKPVVVVDKLVKDFGKLRAVNGLSIVVREKECFGLLGKNGSGKTTSFDMLTGLTIPSGGTASISGRNISQRIQIGYCPQVDALMGQLTGRESLKIVAKLQGYTNSAEVVDMVLDCVGMTEHSDKNVSCYSGGQKRKISIGIALISRSHCVMLDEPTAGIDPRARRDIWDILHCMREKGNSAVVLTSHSMDECEALCTRIVVLREGNMIAEGTSQELKSNFGNFYLLTIVLRNLEQEKQVNEAVISRWPEAILKTKPTSANLIFVFQITKQKDSKWSDSMRRVEELAAQHKVEDFMFTQATLEDAFVRLSTSQAES